MIRLSGKLALLALLCASLLVPPAAHAEPLRLSAAQQSVGAFATTSDGRYAVYEATVASGEDNVYSVPTAGGAPKKLFEITVTVRGPHQISPTSDYVVFTGLQEGSIGLYSVPIDGSRPPIQLNLDLIYSGVDGFQVTPDGRRVIYSLDQSGLDQEDLYSVPIGGPASASVKLTQREQGDGSAARILAISPDSRRVVFSRVSNLSRLYSVPVAGPASAGVLISEHQTRSQPIRDVQISANGSRVLFRDDIDTSGTYDLYSTPLAGPAGARVKLSQPLSAGSAVSRFTVNPNNGRVVYLSAQPQAGLFELYSTPLSGPSSAAVRLSQSLEGGTIDTGGFAISPDGTRVVYTVHYETDRVGALYSVPIAGPASASTLLHTTTVSGGKIRDFALSNDSSRVVYIADDRSRSFPSLYSVPLLGPSASAVKLNPGRTYVGDFHISADSRSVVLDAMFADGQLFRSAYVYKTPIAGPAEAGARLDVLFENTPLRFLVLPDDDRLLYLKITPDEGTPFSSKRELFVAPLGQPDTEPGPDLDQRVYLPMLSR